LSDDEFLSLTPREFFVLVHQHRMRIEHDELLTGILAAQIANWSIGAPKKPRVPSQYMPSRLVQGRRPRQQRERRERINRKQIADDVRAFFERAMKIQNQNG
jgi:hypothetical protein